MVGRLRRSGFQGTVASQVLLKCFPALRLAVNEHAIVGETDSRMYS